MSWYQSYKTLEVYRIAFDASMQILNVTRDFPKEGTILYSDHLRRSSRAVCYHISEAIRTHNHQAVFTHKLTQAKDDAEETMRWIRQSVAMEYMNIETGARLYTAYSSVIGKLVGLLTSPTPQVLQKAA